MTKTVSWMMTNNVLLIRMDVLTNDVRVDGRTTLFYKDGWMDGRRSFIRMGGRTT